MGMRRGGEEKKRRKLGRGVSFSVYFRECTWGEPGNKAHDIHNSAACALYLEALDLGGERGLLLEGE